MDGDGWWMMGGGSLVFLVLVVIVVLFFVPDSQEPRHDRTPRTSAEDVLAERFARGEIDEQEYRSRLNALRG